MSIQVSFLDMVYQYPEDLDKIKAKLEPGLIIGLVGDLGAGKTTFVQLLAKNLGITEVVNSPTFNLQKLYKMATPLRGIGGLLHVDAYRLNTLLELEDIGFFELLKKEGTVAVVEWADRLPGLSEYEKYLAIEFFGIDNPDYREIKILEKS